MRRSTAKEDAADDKLLPVSPTHEDEIRIAVRYSYEKSPDTSRQRIGMARALLREALGRLQGGKPVDAGFSEDAIRRTRTDEMEA